MRTLQGTVVSNKMAKTIVVAVTRLKKHPKYKKYYKVTKRFKAHYEGEPLQDGERVTIQETRPLSKDKRWTCLPAGRKSSI
jgi:small subunit ribosomal protein S17